MGPLTLDQIRQFGDEGYVVVPRLVPAAGVAAANAAIDRLVAEQPPPEGHLGSYALVEKPPERQPALLGLLTHTPAYAIAEQLTAVGGLTGPTHVQVALTYPPYLHRPGSGHIDGLNQLAPDGRVTSFTLLVGVLLSDQSADDMGNVHVWPGSHHAVAAYARDHGISELLARSAETSHPPVDATHRTQVRGRPGDVVFAHYLLAHNIGGNMSSVIRRTVYLRLKRRGHAEHWRQALTDPFFEYDGVRAARGTAGR
ncbi:hypothetical protein [Catellatospora tritici]|uniref:hypothetical protein n=1 Tax=Catellatospora tritici TaxID=2851566 RepID=UPI001C2D3164|nr:hypothetical protein [Catellatospora tritici]MBV1852026.1 hypothetical protein [Catellatospora tritici]